MQRDLEKNWKGFISVAPRFQVNGSMPSAFSHVWILGENKGDFRGIFMQGVASEEPEE